jgi:hypothetical protein
VCTASPKFIFSKTAELPKENTQYTNEGTLAHAFAASMLEGKSVVVPDEMKPHVGVYVDLVNSLKTAGSMIFVEQKIPLFYNLSASGTVDAAILTADTLHIVDLKYGVGVSVEAKDNTQLTIYAESLLQQYDQVMDLSRISKVTMTIVQPRDRNNPEYVRTWTVSREFLKEQAAWLEVRAKIALGDDGEFSPSESSCRFCAAKALCGAYARQGLEALPEEARIITLPMPDTLSREQRIKVLQSKKVLNQWLESLEDQEVSDLMAGKPSIGLKLVRGKANRQWVDTDAAVQLLSNYLTMDEIRPPSDIISPNAAEKALKGKEVSVRFSNRMASQIVKPEGKPTLVPDSDPRQQIDYNQLALIGEIV